MNLSSPKKPLELDEVMLAMDVVDTLRHQKDLVISELSGDNRKQQLVARLQKIYQAQGIEVPDYILEEGVDSLAKDRFTYEPSTTGFGVFLAKIYVSRKKWLKWIFGIILALFLAISSYFYIYLPNKTASAKNAKIEITQTLPNEMDALYQSIYEETKVQTATQKAKEILIRGKIAIREENLTAAKQAVNELTNIRDRLRQEYTLRIVNREGVKSGFWTFPKINTDATNYYLVVEALDKDGNAISLPILNEETGETEIVDTWGIRVSEDIYQSVGTDKQDDGIIQRNIIGNKSYGYLEVQYVVPVLNGAVTRW